MRLRSLTLAAYGRCTDVTVEIGESVTVVFGPNEAGKSTALDALSDLLWGIPFGTPRVSGYARNQLRLDARLDLDGGALACVRRSTGLFADDLVTELIPPWDPDGRGSAQWWRGRLGINHDELRRGGAQVFAGDGDIAELVFAAREGRSAREVLAEIETAADGLFRSRRPSKGALLRVAETAFNAAVADRDLLLTRAGDVVEQRDLVAGLQRDLDRASSVVTTTAAALKQAEEDGRVIRSALSLRRARDDLAALAIEGLRLSPDELLEYTAARAARTRADELAIRLAGEIADLARLIGDLAVDDALLADKAALDRLQPLAQARIDDLARADDEFRPAVDSANARLRGLLQDIGIEAGEDLDAALQGVHVRADHAATLNALADRIEALELKRENAKEKRNEALNGLIAKGIAVDFTTSRPPSEDRIDGLRAELTTARAGVVTQEAMLTSAGRATALLRADAPAARAEATVTQSDVAEHRTARDAHWGQVRRAWVAGALPDAGDRIDMAAGLDALVITADRAADDEASDRARIAAWDARMEAHVDGLEEARQREEAAVSALGDARAHVVRLEGDWARAWADLGIVVAPTVETAPVVVSLLVTAHALHAKDLSAAGRIAELAAPWTEAAALVGLSGASTTAAWRAQSAVLGQIAEVRADRAAAQVREAQGRSAWEAFRAEALDLLERHGAQPQDGSLTPARVQDGLEQLAERLHRATGAAATRTGYRERIDATTVALDEARRTTEHAAAVLQRLAEGHGVEPGPDLDELADRAERAADPLARETAALRDLTSGLDAGSSVAHVILRLDGQGEVTVAQALAEAEERDREAREAADGIRERRATARERLIQLEAAGGAADAEAEVIARQAEVARLTEAWAVLALQRRLLEKVLESMGGDDTRPLLDRAGQILDRLTGGRWVALRAEEDANTRRLMVVRADANRLGTAELSEGTADQVFLALRLAAVAELHAERIAGGQPALPLVLDDVLIAFDDDRTAVALAILRDLAPGLQVIVFTHHRRVADAAARLDGVVVCELPSPAPVAGALDGEQVRAHAQDGAVAIDASREDDGAAVDAAAVRRWAQEQGLPIKDKGRVPRPIVDAYLQAQG